jgi:hypothetical protein
MAILDFLATSYAVECHIHNALTDEMRERFLKAMRHPSEIKKGKEKKTSQLENAVMYGSESIVTLGRLV